jgi:hypothetical protein
MQSKNEAIDVASWSRDKEFAEYPEGARDKTLLYCPTTSFCFQFLRSGQRYLFKRSSPRYVEQFWAEIVAYQLGVQMDIPVPPTFVAYDSNKNQSGALIEWFLKKIDPSNYEDYVPGGDYCQQYIPNFDRKKGKQHNFETVTHIFENLMNEHPTFQVNWKQYWAKTFTFDALIGNTDRHQDNWGIIVNPVTDELRISPIFDNGTSLGHEISANQFDRYADEERLKHYIAKGWHHMKWRQNDGAHLSHSELLKKLANQYPETRQVMLDCLNRVNDETFKRILDSLVAFDVPIRLTTERAAFMLKLLHYRHQRLLIELENEHAFY